MPTQELEYNIAAEKFICHIDILQYDVYNKVETKREGESRMTENEQNAKIFKAFCDANRLKILGLLQNGEKCACQLLEQLDIGQPALSHHMKILCDAEIVVGRKDGKWTYYSFNPVGVAHAKELLNQITTVASETKCSCID